MRGVVLWLQKKTMKKPHDFIGLKRGYLTVVAYAFTKAGQHYLLCECICGRVKRIRYEHLRSRITKTCGHCVKSNGRYVHGMKRKRVYNIWCVMKQRCTNINRKDHAEYGARGITYEPRWENFTDFYADMGAPPTHRHTLDRIKNEKGYSKENCRWATPKEQRANQRPPKLGAA